MAVALCVRLSAQFPIENQVIKPRLESNVKKYISKADWIKLFPNRDIIILDHPGNGFDFYNYEKFIAAARYFPSFLSSENVEINKRELCAFLANMAYETGGGWEGAPGGYYSWGLRFIEERNCEKGCPQYTDSTKLSYPPVPGRSYHGRGGLQLSWNYNYGQFSEFLFGAKEKLLQEPELVSNEAILAFASALWFWITPQYPKPSCHDIINNKWIPNSVDTLAHRLPGFGAVINVINGGLECNKPPSAATNYRYGYYLFFCKYFKVPPGENAGCAEQKPFGAR